MYRMRTRPPPESVTRLPPSITMRGPVLLTILAVRVSVIVCSYNGAATLTAACKQLLDASEAAMREVEGL